MKYYVRQPNSTDLSGPFTVSEIRRQLDEGDINNDFEVLDEPTARSFWSPERSRGWRRVASVFADDGSLVNQEPVNASSGFHRMKPERASQIEQSGVAIALKVISILQLACSPIAGLFVGNEFPFAGWYIFISGLIGGLVLLGFATVIDHGNELLYRLRNIEAVLMENSESFKKEGRSRSFQSGE